MRNVAYTSPTAWHELDLYLPHDGTGCPAIIWVHGGGWMNGSKALQPGAVDRVLRHVPRGFAVISIDYRLSDAGIFPAQIHDVKAAIRFVKANAATYRIDPDRVALWGTSAGGHLAALAGTTAGVAALEDLTQGNASESSRVARVIDCYGPTDLPKMDSALMLNGCRAGHDDPGSPESRFLGCTQGLQSAACQLPAQQANPMTWVSSDDPPFLISHGSADCTVPWQQSQMLHDVLVDAGVPSSFSIRDGGAHLIGSCPEDPAIDAFLDAL